MKEFTKFDIEGDLPNISFLVSTRNHGLLYFKHDKCFQVLDNFMVYVLF